MNDRENYVDCPHCHQRVKLDVDLSSVIGKTVGCPHCDKPMKFMPGRDGTIVATTIEKR